MNEITKILQKASEFGSEAREIFSQNKGKSSPIKKYQPCSSYKIGILTSTPDEFNVMADNIANLKEIDSPHNDATIYYGGEIISGDKRISCVMPYPTGMGIANSVSNTTKLVTHFEPEYIFMVGVCAGNKNVTKLGDIIIAEKSLNYNEVVAMNKEGESTKKKFQQNADSIDNNLKSRLQIFANSDTFKSIKGNYPDGDKFKGNVKCHVGLMVTGSSLSRSAELMKEINSTYHGVKGMDMETQGFYFSASNSFKNQTPKYVSIKSVSDYGDSTNHKLSGEERKNYALFTSSVTAIEFIKEYVK